MSESSSSDKRKNWKPATQLVRSGTMRTPWMETSEAMILSSGYTYDSAEQAAARMAGDEDGFVYSRYANPTLAMLEERLCDLEGAEACRVTASGMAAIHACLVAPIQHGDRVVAASALFGSCRWIITNVLPKYGVDVEFVDGTDIEQWKSALSKPTKLVLVESPANPMLDAVDIEAVADLTHAAGGKLIVDNVFATPIFQKPLEMGADYVVYSMTKHMDGQGRVLGGAILGPAQDFDEIFDPYLRHTGPALSAFNAWILLKGLETLDLRVRAQSKTAAYLADKLSDDKAFAAIRYPGRKDHPQYDIHAKQMSSGGSLLALSFKGGQDAAFRFLNGLNLVDISNNLGDAKSLACHPASTTHRALTDEERASMGLDGSWIRMSVGLEDPDDILDDLVQAAETA